MKALPLSLQDKALLNARNMADISHIKEFSSLNLSRHRSVINAFVHIIAYQINPFKPKRNLQPRYRLNTTVRKSLIRVNTCSLPAGRSPTSAQTLSPPLVSTVTG